MKELIVVIGLGYVGLPLAVEFASSRQVIGFDIDQKKVKELGVGFDRTGEVGSSLLNAVSRNLEVSADPSVLARGSIFIVTVPTPITEAYQPDFGPLLSACESIGPHLAPGSIVIFESTVYPGCTEEMCIPVLEQTSGLKCDLNEAAQESFSVGYSPERINPGDNKHRLRDIVKVVSGSSPNATARIRELYDSIIHAGIHVVSSIKVAEAAKVIENSQRDINIAFVNELAQIFDNMDISVLDVLDAARTKWNFLDFRPGLVGGHCIGVDPYYLAYGAQKVGYDPKIVLSGREVNNQMSDFLVSKILKALSRNGVPICAARIGVLGLTFKENCRDFRNSKSIGFVHDLVEWGCKVYAVDPYSDCAEESQLINIEIVDLSALQDLDALVCLVPHAQFAKLRSVDLKVMSRLGRRLLIFDLSGILKDACKNSNGILMLSV